jgi:hypothetical protein
MTPELIVLLCILSFLFGLACGAMLLQRMYTSALNAAEERRRTVRTIQPDPHYDHWRDWEKAYSIEQRRRHNDG